MTYKYLDGTGNTYVITKTQIEFKPIEKEFSSSGYIETGEAKNK